MQLDFIPRHQTPFTKIIPQELKLGRLPFTVRVVRTEEDLSKAVRIRQTAYARHLPELADHFHAPEQNDLADGSLVLLAESKMDGSALGSVRIQTNRYHPLPVEESVPMPAWLRGKRTAEMSRLGVDSGRIGSVVKTALFKACYLFSVKSAIDWMVITARPPLDRQYAALSFQDLYPGRLIAMRHVGDIPHRVMALEVDTLQQRWVAMKHRLYDFGFETRHSDIDLGGADLGSAHHLASMGSPVVST